MTASELDDVTALLERVLPDPTGFAERLVEQLVTRWAAADPLAGHPVVQGEAGASDLGITPDPDADLGAGAADATLVLAAALGACDCWGLAPDCPVCAGEGTSGWTEPDPELFREFVGPAVVRLSADQKASASPGTAGESCDDQTVGDQTDGDYA